MHRDRYILFFLLLMTAWGSLAWVVPVPSLPYVLINERGDEFRTEPVHVAQDLTFKLTAETTATLQIYDMRGTLMARRVLAPQWHYSAVRVDVRRWERGDYEILIETAGQQLRFPLCVE